MDTLKRFKHYVKEKNSTEKTIKVNKDLEDQVLFFNSIFFLIGYIILFSIFVFIGNYVDSLNEINFLSAFLSFWGFIIGLFLFFGTFIAGIMILFMFGKIFSDENFSISYSKYKKGKQIEEENLNLIKLKKEKISKEVFSKIDIQTIFSVYDSLSELEKKELQTLFKKLPKPSIEEEMENTLRVKNTNIIND